MKYLIIGLNNDYEVGYTGRYETETADDAIAEFLYNCDLWVQNEGGIICLEDTEHLTPVYGLMDIYYAVEMVDMVKRYGSNWQRECLEELGYDDETISDWLECIADFEAEAA